MSVKHPFIYAELNSRNEYRAITIECPVGVRCRFFESNPLNPDDKCLWRGKSAACGSVKARLAALKELSELVTNKAGELIQSFREASGE